MRRLLSLILSLTLVITALAVAATACAAMSADDHDCCEDETIVQAPPPQCCVLAAPVQGISNTGLRSSTPDPRVALPTIGGGAAAVIDLVPERAVFVPPPRLRGPSVPLYLHQRALLI